MNSNDVSYHKDIIWMSCLNIFYTDILNIYYIHCIVVLSCGINNIKLNISIILF